MGEFSGRVAIVTGAASGIGHATAGALLAEGAAVLVVDRQGGGATQAAEALGEGAAGMDVDVTDRADVQAMTAFAIERFGRIDVLVNSAGIVSKHRFLDLPSEAWDAMLDVHVKGTFLCLQEVARRMVESGGGAVVNVSSIAAELGNPLAVHYATAKGAVRMLTRSAAVALGRHGVRVNAVGPGTTETPLTAGRMDKPAARSATLQRIPMGRLGQANDVAEVITFLASDRSRYVTGQTIYVDGGWTAQLYTSDYEDLQYSLLDGTSS